MYHRILLLIDCSEVDRAALSHVAGLAAVHESTVHLFHVVHAHTLDQERTLKEQADSCLSAGKTVLEEAGVQTESSTALGEPGEQILKKIGGSDFDLVALATHGHRLLGDFILGSVSRELMHNCDVPLLVVPGDKD